METDKKISIKTKEIMKENQKGQICIV